MLRKLRDWWIYFKQTHTRTAYLTQMDKHFSSWVKCKACDRLIFSEPITHKHREIIELKGLTLGNFLQDALTCCPSCGANSRELILASGRGVYLTEIRYGVERNKTLQQVIWADSQKD